MIQVRHGAMPPRDTAETYICVFKKMAKEAVRASAALLLSHAKIRMSLGVLPRRDRAAVVDA